MSWKDDAPQFNEQQINRLQRGLRRDPHQRKMRNYDTLGAVFSFVFGFAIGAAIVYPLIPFDGSREVQGVEILAGLFSGFLGGLLVGFLPAGAFFLGFKIPIHFGTREPSSSRPPIYFGVLGAPIAFATMHGLEALNMEPAWAFLSLFVWAFLSGWIWVQLSPKKEELSI